MSLFVVLEGIDGSGTTTVSRQVVERLNSECIPALFTFEPSDGPIGTVTRQALQHQMEIDFRGMFGLFLADRWWHLDNVIKPALEAGQVVVCDRYHLSTWVYQQDVYPRLFLEGAQKDILCPDLVYVLDVPAEVAHARKTGEEEKYDDLDRQRSYRNRYLEAFRGYRLRTEKVCCLDSEFRSATYNTDLIIKDIKDLLNIQG